MANKRQRLARKRFSSKSTRATPLSSNISAEVEKNARSHHEKRKRLQHADSGVVGDPADRLAKKKPKLIKHPLRIAGTKPGEGCFICKAVDHIARCCPRKQEKDRKKVCLFCRELGHTLKNCLKKQDVQELKICFNCGGAGHRSAECRDIIRDGGATFAECFVCRQKGHLSKNCPSNTHGIYPKGGSCKVCDSITHLAKDCPEKVTGKPTDNGSGRVKLQISKEVAIASPPGGNSKRIVFGSGDDLEDDFFDAGNDQPIGSGSETNEQRSHVSRKKSTKKERKMTSSPEPVIKQIGKRTPKVVNFFQ